MSRPLSSVNAAAVVSAVTRPIYLIEMLFTTPLRLSTRETITYDSNTFTAAGVTVDLSGPAIKLFNADLAYTATFLDGADGIACNIWAVYGEPTFDHGDADQVFAGEIGACGVGEDIVIRLRQASRKLSPRLFVVPPTFNHLPPDGLTFLTPSGQYVLERGD